MFRSLFFAISVLLQIHVAEAHLGNFRCRSAFGSFDAESKIATEYRHLLARVSREQRESLQAIKDRFHLSTPSENLRTVVLEMQKKLQNNKALNPVARGEKMAEFAKAFEAILGDQPKKVKSRIFFELARSVVLLEAFPIESYVEKGSMSYESNRGGFVHVADYPAWVESYVKDEAPYAMSGNNNLFSAQVMRDMASHNLWPVTLKPHDTRHVHYALGHPRGPAIYFMAARSMNHIRYGLLATMYEGVDNVQFAHESALARYFSRKGLDLEEAMLTIGRATQAELIQIMDGAGISNSIYNNFSSSWTPSYVPGRVEAGARPKGLQLELDLMIRYFDEYRSDKGRSKFFHYRQNLQDENRDDPSIH